MRAVAVAIASIVLTGCATAAKPSATGVLAGEDKIRPACEEEWPGDWSMIASCVRTETQGFRAVQGFVDVHSIRDSSTTPQAKILAKCSREWRTHGHPNWSMIASCVRTQWAGYRELNP
jgi:hypothetical protein